MSIPDNDDIFEAGLTAWNTLTVLMDSTEPAIKTKEEFKDFYTLVIDRLTTEEVTE